MAVKERVLGLLPQEPMQLSPPQRKAKCQRFTSFTTFFTTNTFIPTGGVINLSMITKMTEMPNQINSPLKVSSRYICRIFYVSAKCCKV